MALVNIADPMEVGDMHREIPDGIPIVVPSPLYESSDGEDMFINKPSIVTVAFRKNPFRFHYTDDRSLTIMADAETNMEVGTSQAEGQATLFGADDIFLSTAFLRKLENNGLKDFRSEFNFPSRLSLIHPQGLTVKSAPPGTIAVYHFV